MNPPTTFTERKLLMLVFMKPLSRSCRNVLESEISREMPGERADTALAPPGFGAPDQ